MRNAERCGSTSSEIDGFRVDMIGFASSIEFGEECIDEGIVFVVSTFFDIETAIRTELGAEGDMKIKVFDGFHGVGKTYL